MQRDWLSVDLLEYERGLSHDQAVLGRHEGHVNVISCWIHGISKLLVRMCISIR